MDTADDVAEPYYADHATRYRHAARMFRLLLDCQDRAPPADRLRWLRSATECHRMAEQMAELARGP